MTTLIRFILKSQRFCCTRSKWLPCHLHFSLGYWLLWCAPFCCTQRICMPSNVVWTFISLCWQGFIWTSPSPVRQFYYYLYNAHLSWSHRSNVLTDFFEKSTSKIDIVNGDIRAIHMPPVTSISTAFWLQNSRWSKFSEFFSFLLKTTLYFTFEWCIIFFSSVELEHITSSFRGK